MANAEIQVLVTPEPQLVSCLIEWANGVLGVMGTCMPRINIFYFKENYLVRIG